MGDLKTCKICREEKNLGEFYKTGKSNKQYFQSSCKICYTKRQRNYYQENKKARINYQKHYIKWRYQNDEIFRLTHILRARIHAALNTKNTQKNNSTFYLLGCSKNWILYWLNFTKLFYCPLSTNTHIDHLIPCSSFDLKDDEEKFHCFNWRNLRIIDANENLVKSAKYPSEEELIIQQKLIYTFRIFMRGKT